MASRTSVVQPRALGVPGVHPQQVAGEQRRLLAALAGLDLEDRVLVVGRVARHQQVAQPLLGGVAARRRARSASSANAGSSAASSRAASRSSPSRCHSRQVRDDRGQLGVPLVEPLGQPLRRRAISGSASRCSSSACSATQALDGLEHRRSSRLGLVRTDERAPAPQERGRRRRGATWRSASSAWLGRLLGVAGLEAGDAAAGVEDLLLAGVERVAAASTRRRG